MKNLFSIFGCQWIGGAASMPKPLCESQAKQKGNETNSADQRRPPSARINGVLIVLNKVKIVSEQ